MQYFCQIPFYSVCHLCTRTLYPYHIELKPSIRRQHLRFGSPLIKINMVTFLPVFSRTFRNYPEMGGWHEDG